MALGSKDGVSPRGGDVLARRVSGVDARRTVSSRHERGTAGALGGSIQRASGATERHKGDVQTRDLLVECKTRLPTAADGARSIRVEAGWLEKITREAHAAGKDPALAFEIPGISDLSTERRWVALPESVLARLLERACATDCAL